MQILEDELKIPCSYIKNTSRDDWFEAVLHHDWLRKIKTAHAIAAHPKHDKLSESEVRAQLLQGNLLKPPWTRTYIKILKKEDKLALPLPKVRINLEDKGALQLSYSQILYYVAVTNYKNLWKEATKKHSDCPLPQNMEDNSPVSPAKYNDVLREAILRLYDCQVINISSSSLCTSYNEQMTQSSQTSPNIFPALAIIESDSNFYIIQDAALVYTVHDSVNLSPALLGASYSKPLLLIYQLLQTSKWLHERGLALGNIFLSDLFLSDDLWIQVFPKVEDSIHCIESRNENDLKSHVQTAKWKDTACDISDVEQVDSLCKFKFCLSRACKEWVHGKLSNFDYLMLLNKLSGRKFGDPKCHYIFPWVSDFTSRSGNNFRDLTKSKYRLNKGDRQLDLTFDTSNNTSAKQIPHHISDVLSEITYYIYLSRRIPKNILCQYVRTKWVPAEYPSSMQRLQSWTPDECIPEFFSDPHVFESVHKDLPNLEIPSWATDFNDFVQWHRSILESNYVSEKLNHWIDLTFGYKLSGKAAVKSKNVCLQLVDNHTSLTSSGISQLFNLPHPHKLTAALYHYSNIPLRIFASSKTNDTSLIDEDYCDDLDESFDSQASNKSTSSSLTFSKFLSRSRNSLLTIGSTDSPSAGSNEKTTSNADIFLPQDYNPTQLLSTTESYLSFMKKTWHKYSPNEEKSKKKCKELTEFSTNSSATNNVTAESFRQLVSLRRTNEMYVLSCLIVEIFSAAKLRAFGIVSNRIKLKDRIRICKSVFDQQMDSFPFCVRNLVKALFENQLHNIPAVTKYGVPPPSAYQLLIPNLCLGLLQFPDHIVSVYEMFKIFHELLSLVERDDDQDLVENYVKVLTSELDKMANSPVFNDHFVYLILPNIIKLFEHPVTNIVSIWYMFDRMSKLLGVKGTQKYLSDLIIQLYNFDNCMDSKFMLKMNKYLKFYHRNFILCLIIRFGFKTFLENLIGPLVEAVGCYRDVICNRLSFGQKDSYVNETDLEEHEIPKLCNSPGRFSWTGNNVPKSKSFPKISNENTDRSSPVTSLNLDIDFGIETSDNQFNTGDSYLDGEEDVTQDNKMKFSETAADTLIWFSSRIGPVLSARYITHNLLRMLTLSYSDINNLRLCENLEADHIWYLNSEIEGDKLSENILKCLMFCVTLYGENFIILQYLPHIVDVVSTCRKNKITANLEGGLIGSLVLLKHIVSYIPEEQISCMFQETFCDNILYPCILTISSKSVQFPNDSISRACLILKFIDAVTVLSLLIPPKQLHIISPILQTFFKCFSHCNIKNQDGGMKERSWTNSVENDVVHNLRQIFSPKLAFIVYDFFSKHFSESFMERVIINYTFIKDLCENYRKSSQQSNKINIPQANKSSDLNETISSESAGSFGQNIVITGNRIDLFESELNSSMASNPQNNENVNKQRHLSGNWLAYWEHELNQLNFNFQFNQIRLQQFNSHQSSIKSLCILDNENSFLSGSRDKTVKIWSIHNEGDGNHISGCQWTYTSHKKSVMSLAFVDKHRVIASTDANVHLWDPFLGISLNQLNTSHCVNTLKTISSSTSNILAANTDACVLVLDTRIAQYVSELKVSMSPTGLIRCIAVSPSENWIAVGQTSGFLTVLDLRTGMVLLYWKAHEGEILQLIAYNDSTLISSSLDQTVSVWNINDGKLTSSIKGLTEPVHCMALLNSQLISGTTANKIGVHSSINVGATFSPTKLKAETFKGVMTSLAVLPLNRLLLLGSDNGGITLMC